MSDEPTNQYGRPSLEWLNTAPGILRSTDGQYVIMTVTLPEEPLRYEYHVRKVDPAMAAAYPERVSLGVFRDSSPWLYNTENDVHSAQAMAERDAYATTARRPDLADLPAEAMAKFFWPISDGTTRVALVLQRDDDGRLFARVIGMTLHTYEEGFVPGTWVEIEVPQ